MLKRISLLAAVLSFPFAATDKVAADVTGFWTLPGDTRVEVSKCANDEICARIVSLKEPNYPSEMCEVARLFTPLTVHNSA